MENNITLNKSKCVFSTNVIDFFGVRFSEQGMSPDIKKIETILHAEPPSNITELRSFLGMVNFSAHFIENYSAKTSKLRELLKSSVKWKCTKEHQDSFEKLRKSLSESTILSYFDVNLNTKIICDASPIGLGAMLVQTQPDGQDKVICYASRALTNGCD